MLTGGTAHLNRAVFAKERGRGNINQQQNSSSVSSRGSLEKQNLSPASLPLSLPLYLSLCPPSPCPISLPLSRL